jgi:hypothetical protein
MANRTIQFHGLAYGDVPVQLNAHINGQLVFSGAVNTQAGEVPTPQEGAPNPVLFSVANSALFPTSFEGSYPMTISVATGNGITINEVSANYCPTDFVTFVGSISGTTLTVNSVSVGELKIGQKLDLGDNVGIGEIVSGSGTTWQISTAANLSEATIYGIISGTADIYGILYNSTPTNTDNNFDSRSSVTIDGVAQVPIPAGQTGQNTWTVLAGSTLACNLNVSQGSE